MIPEPLTQLGLPLEAQENWSRNWELSQASFPKEGVFFAQEAFLREVAEVSRLRPEARPALFASGQQIRENEALSRLDGKRAAALLQVPLPRNPIPTSVTSMSRRGRPPTMQRSGTTSPTTVSAPPTSSSAAT